MKYFSLIKKPSRLCSVLGFLLSLNVVSTGVLAQPDNPTPEYVIIRSASEVTFSSETAAKIAQIFVKEGSRFRSGDILLQLDCRIQQAELKKAQAQEQAASVAAVSAKKLESYGSISEFELVKALTDEEVAQADVDKLRAVVEKCVIRAPFNGAVSELKVNADESVKPGDPLLTVVDTDNLEFEIQVPSVWLRWLHVGSVFTVHVNEIDKTISGKITKINPQIESVSQTVKVVGTITNPNPALLPGMSGQATFPEKPTEASQQKIIPPTVSPHKVVPPNANR